MPTSITIAPWTDDDRGSSHQCVSSGVEPRVCFFFLVLFAQLIIILIRLCLQEPQYMQHRSNTWTNVNGAWDADASQAPGIYLFFVLFALLTIIITRLRV